MRKLSFLMIVLMICFFSCSTLIAVPIQVNAQWLIDNFSEELPNWTFEDDEEEEIDYEITADLEFAGRLFIG